MISKQNFTELNNTWYNDYVMRPRSYSRGLRNRKTYAKANANAKSKLGYLSFLASDGLLVKWKKYIWQETDGRRDRRRDGQGNNIMPPVRAPYAVKA